MDARREISDAEQARLPVLCREEAELPAISGSAPAAREVLRRAVQGHGFGARLDDAELAVSELVTNAVVHGRRPITLRVLVTAEALRIEVADASAVSPTFSMLDPTAVTGRGLVLVSALADAWGVEPGPDGKVVWCEFHLGTEHAEHEADVDELLAAWGDDMDEDPAREKVRLVLTDMPTRAMAVSESHVAGLLRELSLLEDQPSALGPEDRGIVENLRNASLGLADALNHMRRQVSRAVAAGEPTCDVTLTMRRQDAELLRDYGHAIDAAEGLYHRGVLLGAPVPPDVRDFRRSYLRRLLLQLVG